MNFIKKFLVSLFKCLLLIISFCGGANALFGNTHYNIGKKILKKVNVTLSESEKKAFLSGTVYADIGRFKFDKATQVASDSKSFVKEMKNHVSTIEEKWFVYGIEMHILQDEKTEEILENIFEHKCSNYLNYILDCGILDFYFLNKNRSYIYTDFLNKFDFSEVASGLNLKAIGKLLNIPDNKIEPTCHIVLSEFYNLIEKDSLSAYDKLIIKTYKSLGLEITQEDVYKQQANSVGAFAIASSISGKQYFQAEIGPKIEAECEKIADLCINILKDMNKCSC